MNHNGNAGIEVIGRFAEINRQRLRSKQPRFGRPNPRDFFTSIIRLTSTLSIHNEPAYGTADRDNWLRQVWKQEPYLAGVVNSVVAIDKNRGWSITGGRNQVRRFTNALHRFYQAPDVKGWRQSFGASALSYYTTDLGSVTEIGRDGRNGPLTELYFVDPARCKLTGDVDQPLNYQPTGGKVQHWKPGDYFRITSLPSTDETKQGLGYCAVSRCIELAKIMVGIYQYDNEMLLNRAPRGLLLLKGITEQQWEDAMEGRKAKLDGDEMAYYGAVHVLATLDPGVELEAQLVTLSQLPAEFDQRTFTDLLMMGYALIFGYDIREFWPVTSGALGTATETETQHRKAGAKGGLDFVLGFQEQLQEEMPETVHFEFEERDQDGELAEAELEAAKAEPVVALRESGLRDTGEGIISREEARIMLAERGLIDPDWTIEQEDVEATDTEDVERVLRSAEVQRAMWEFPGEPIVRYRWPEHRYEVLVPARRQIHRTHFSFPTEVRRQGPEDFEQELEMYQERLENLTQSAMDGETEPEDFDRELEALTAAILVLALLRGMSPEETTEEQQLLLEASLMVLEDSSDAAVLIGIETLTDAELLRSALPGEAVDLFDQEMAGAAASTLSGDVYGGLYDDNAQGLISRLAMWGLTAYGLWNAGKLIGRPQQYFQWRVGPTEHCADCARLNEQVHTGEEWNASGWRPQGRNLACTGRRCLCSLAEVSGPSRGDF